MDRTPASQRRREVDRPEQGATTSVGHQRRRRRRPRQRQEGPEWTRLGRYGWAGRATHARDRCEGGGGSGNTRDRPDDRRIERPATV